MALVTTTALLALATTPLLTLSAAANPSHGASNHGTKNPDY